jgi:hypothetical protein
MPILKRGMPYKGETDPTKITWSFLKHLCIEHLEHLFAVNNIPIPENIYYPNNRKTHLITQFSLISDDMIRKERMADENGQKTHFSS